MAQISLLSMLSSASILKARAGVAAFVAVELFGYFAAVSSNAHLQNFPNGQKQFKDMFSNKNVRCRNFADFDI